MLKYLYNSDIIISRLFSRSHKMELTKKKLKEIIKEEIEHLSETGELHSLTESEKQVFKLILEKLSTNQLQDLGLKRI